MSADTPSEAVPVALKPWVCVDFPYFVGVRHLNSEEWARIFLKPSGFEVDLEALGLRVRLHGNGIEFLGPAAEGVVVPMTFKPPKEP